MTQERYKICAHGALKIVLYVMRALGAAPLVFEARGVRVSRFFSIVGRVLNTFTSMFVIFDACLQLFPRNPENTLISRVFWAFITGGALVTTMIAVYTATSRMHLYLQSMQCLNQIPKDISDSNLEKTEKKIDLLMTCIVVICFICIITVYMFYAINGLQYFHGINGIRHIIQKIIHCSERVLLTAVTMQFALLTLRVLFTLQHVNAQFSRLVEIHSACNCVLEVSRIRQFAFSYMSVCSVVSQVVENDENIIIVIVFTFFSSLGWIVQTFFSEIYKHDLLNLAVNSIHITITGCTYLIYLVMLIEPCHRVHEEMEITQKLVCKSLQYTNLSVQATNELEVFKLLLKLNKPTYSPLSVCTLARPLFLKVIGALLSYGVFVLQLSEDFF